MKTVFIFLTSFVYTFTFCQTLKGCVKDSITGEKLQYANISFLGLNQGTNTDSYGNFVLNINGHTNDSLNISYVGYSSIKVPLTKFKNNTDYSVNFSLSPLENKLESVIISQKKIDYKKKYTIKERKEGDIAMFSLIGYESTCLVKNDFDQLGRVKSIKIYVRKNKSANFIAKFKVKIYSYDKVKNEPGESILNEDIIISPKNKTYKYTLDLENKKIPFFEDGICIGIEMFDEKGTSKKGDKIGPGLRFTYGENEQFTWYRYRDKDWIKNSFYNRKNNDISNLMIGLTVLMKN